MKIGIIIHSKTGNTLKVAQKLQERLQACGHLVEIHRLESKNGFEDNSSRVQFEKLPVIQTYDALILGGPVRAFSISPVLAAFIQQIQTMQNKQMACFVTQQLPYPWLGGNRAIKQITKMSTAKGTRHLGSEIVNWKAEGLEQRISDAVTRISVLF